MNSEAEMVADGQYMHISKDQTSLFKGIAIFLVLFDHIGENVGWFPSLPLGAVGVYIFLFLSGYGLMYSTVTNGIAGYWTKRIKKVYLPYIIVIVFCVILSVCFMHKVSLNFIKYLIFWKTPFKEYWYLYIQIEWYVAFFLIWNVKVKLSLDMKWTLLLMALADILIVSVNISDRKFAWTLGAFVIGGCVVYYGSQRLYQLRSWKLGVLLTAIAVIAVIYKKTPYVERYELGFIDTILQLVIVFCIAAFIVLFVEVMVKRFKVFEIALLRLGVYSYEIYLIHSVYLDILRDANFKGNSRFIAILMFIFLTSITTVSLKYLMSLLLRGKKDENQ